MDEISTAKFNHKIRDAARKFIADNFSKQEPGDLYIVENAMRTGIILFIEHMNEQAEPLRQTSLDKEHLQLPSDLNGK